MRYCLLAFLLALPVPALAQDMESMPGMDLSHSQPAASPPPPAPQLKGTDQPPGHAEPPPVAHDSPAARYYDPQAMAAAAEAAMHPPTPTYSQALLDLAEYRTGNKGYSWEGEAWTGDLNRFLLRSKGDGTASQRLDSSEVQALYSRALDPWWNIEAGFRQDIRPTPARSYATLGIEGVAPYRFDLLAQAFLSDKGQLTARFEASVDEYLTRRLILQPRAELNLSAQDMPEQHLNAGLTEAELGLRLGYQISRQFTPYVGLSWQWVAGSGSDNAPASLVLGFRGWF